MFRRTHVLCFTGHFVPISVVKLAWFCLLAKRLVFVGTSKTMQWRQHKCVNDSTVSPDLFGGVGDASAFLGVGYQPTWYPAWIVQFLAFSGPQQLWRCKRIAFASKTILSSLSLEGCKRFWHFRCIMHLLLTRHIWLVTTLAFLSLDRCGLDWRWGQDAIVENAF